MANLFQAIADVRASIGHIAKGSKAGGSLGYTYQGWEDVLPAVRHACDEAGLVILPSIKSSETTIGQTKNGGTSYRTTVVMEFVLGAAGSPDTAVMTWAGEAIDTGDKGLQKAATSATKYFLLKLFQIATKEDAGHDPDAIANPEKESAKSSKPKAETTDPVLLVTKAIYRSMVLEGDSKEALNAKSRDAKAVMEQFIIKHPQNAKAILTEWLDHAQGDTEHVAGQVTRDLTGEAS